eukprot:scaffold17736_cov62-Phaeocystis_antarctica.AAC.1
MGWAEGGWSLQLLPALGFGFQDGVGFQHFLVIVDDEPGPFLLEQVGCDRAEVAGTSSRALRHQPVVSHAITPTPPPALGSGFWWVSRVWRAALGGNFQRTQANLV